MQHFYKVAETQDKYTSHESRKGVVNGAMGQIVENI
jgi:hypothetical protein